MAHHLNVHVSTSNHAHVGVHASCGQLPAHSSVRITPKRQQASDCSWARGVGVLHTTGKLPITSYRPRLLSPPSWHLLGVPGRHEGLFHASCHTRPCPSSNLPPPQPPNPPPPPPPTHPPQVHPASACGPGTPAAAATGPCSSSSRSGVSVCPAPCGPLPPTWRRDRHAQRAWGAPLSAACRSMPVNQGPGIKPADALDSPFRELDLTELWSGVSGRPGPAGALAWPGL